MTTHRALGEPIRPSRSSPFLAVPRRSSAFLGVPRSTKFVAHTPGSSLTLGVPPRIEIAGAQRSVGIRQRLPDDSGAIAMISVAGADTRSNKLNRRGNVADPQHLSSSCGVPTSFARSP